MNMNNAQTVSTRRALWSKLIMLKAQHGKNQRTGFSIQTGSPGCGLTHDQICERNAALRVEMDAVRAQLAALDGVS